MKTFKYTLAIFISMVLLLPMFLRDVDASPDNNWETFELEILAKTSEFAWRKDNILHLKLLDGSAIQLTDVPYDSKGKNTGYVIHRLVRYIEQSEYFVIGISHRAGSNSVLIDRKSGQRVELDGIAVFSPDKTRFFTIDFFTTGFIRHPNSKHRMQIWKISPSGPTLEWEFQPSFSVWFDVDATWTSDTNIFVARLEHWTYNDGEKTRVRRVRRESDLMPTQRGWLIQDRLPRFPDPPSI